MKNGTWCSWNNNNKKKNIKGAIGQLYTYLTICEKKNVIIIHIYGSRALFCDHQDTEYESREMEIGLAGTILTQKKTPKALLVNDIYNPQDERKNIGNSSYLWS